jgi:hypothetical protein
MVEGPARCAFKDGKGRRQQSERCWRRRRRQQAAAELDGGSRAAEDEVDGSRSKLVNRSRGEGFGSISIYMESQPVPT